MSHCNTPMCTMNGECSCMCTRCLAAQDDADAYARGRAEERAAVVAWARGCAANNALLGAESTNPDVKWRTDRDAKQFAFIATCVERGDHLPREAGEDGEKR